MSATLTTRADVVLAQSAFRAPDHARGGLLVTLVNDHDGARAVVKGVFSHAAKKP